MLASPPITRSMSSLHVVGARPFESATPILPSSLLPCHLPSPSAICRKLPALTMHRRRYVIRVRAETDQFLLSCVELSTLIKWLENLFAAIDVAAPIDDRDFPRDQS